jgi:putative endonuclease
MHKYFVYILSSFSKALYTGITNDLVRRMAEHKKGVGSKFASKYKITSLVYFEEGDDVNQAIFREKQIKAWRRSKKLALINESNPDWKDLSKDWFS